MGSPAPTISVPEETIPVLYKDPKTVLIEPLPGRPFLEILYSNWLQSRNEYPVQLPTDIREDYEASKEAASNGAPEPRPYTVFPELYIDDPKGLRFFEYYDKQIDLILSIDIPILESISFVFVVEDMPISLREQLVRHREAAFWIQSGRIRDQRTFASRGDYRVPPAFRKDQELLEMWREGHEYLEKLFNRLLEKGAQIEDARDILPPSQLHRGSVSITFRDLKYIVGKRTSFIAQQSMWGPLIRSLATEIARIDTRLLRVFEPPPIKNGKYIGDPHELENLRRFQGNDPLPPDPIFLKYEGLKHVGDINNFHPDQDDAIEITLIKNRGPNAIEQLLEYAVPYARMWGKDLMLKHCWMGVQLAEKAFV